MQNDDNNHTHKEQQSKKGFGSACLVTNCNKKGKNLISSCPFYNICMIYTCL